MSKADSGVISLQNVGAFVKPVIIVLLAMFSLDLPLKRCNAQERGWELAQGPEGGMITRMIISSSGLEYCGTYSRGHYWRKNFRTGLWERVVYANRNAAMGTYILEMALAGTGHIVLTTNQARSFRSSDFGETWAELKPFFGGRGLVGTNDGVFYAGSGSFQRSMNGGSTFQRIDAPPLNKIVPVTSSKLYALGSAADSLLYSEDYGETWIKVGVVARDVYVADGQYSVALSKRGDSLHILRDAQVARKQAIGTACEDCRILAGREGAWIALVRSNGMVSVSQDEGISWTLRVGEMPSGAHTDLRSCGDTIYASTRYLGVFRLDVNRGGWNSDLAGMYNTSIASIAPTSDGAFVLAEGNGVHEYRSSTKTWKRITPFDGALYTKIIRVSDDEIVIIAKDTLLHRYDRRVNRLEVLPKPQWNIYDIAVVDGIYYGLTRKGIVKSTDAGYSWALTLCRDSTLEKIGVDQGRRVYAVGSRDQNYINPDGGNLWYAIKEQIPIVDLNIRQLCFNPASGRGMLLAWIEMHISEDSGKTWQRHPLSAPETETLLLTNDEILSYDLTTLRKYDKTARKFIYADSIPYDGHVGTMQTYGNTVYGGLTTCGLIVKKASTTAVYLDGAHPGGVLPDVGICARRIRLSVDNGSRYTVFNASGKIICEEPAWGGVLEKDAAMLGPGQYLIRYYQRNMPRYIRVVLY